MNYKIVVFCVIFFFCFLGCEQGLAPESTSGEDELSDQYLAKATTFMSRELIEEYDYLSGECLDEMLHIYYRYEQLIHTILDGKGGFHAVIRYRPIGTVAYGADTDRVWRPVGAISVIQHSGKLGEKYILTSAGCFNWKADQKGPNLTEPWTVHLTVLTNGKVTANLEFIRFICNPEK